MTVKQYGPTIATIDLRSVCPKVGSLEVLAWVEYSNSSNVDSMLCTDSLSFRLLKTLQCFRDVLQLDELMADERIVFAASLGREKIENDTWGAVDIKKRESYGLVAVFNNGRLTQLQIDQLLSALEKLLEMNKYRLKVSWQFWGEYSSIRKIFQKQRLLQLGR
mgnify:CR=1 FL=1